MSQVQNELILIAIVPQALKDSVVDALMEQTSLSGFSLSKIQGFSQVHSHYNVAEQVSGYRDFYRFEITHESQQSSSLIELLALRSEAKSIRYWVLPIIESGVV